MDRRDFLKYCAVSGTAGIWLKDMKAAPAVDFAESHRIASSMNNVISIRQAKAGTVAPRVLVSRQPIAGDCFTCLSQVPYCGVIGVVGEDAEIRTLVAKRCAETMMPYVSTLLFDPYYPITGATPPVPVMMAWQNNWMFDEGAERMRRSSFWFRQLIRDCHDHKFVAVTVIPLVPRKEPAWGWGDRDDALYMNNGGWMFFCSFALRVRKAEVDEPGDIVATVKKNRWYSGPIRGDRFFFAKTAYGLKEVHRYRPSTDPLFV